MSEQQRDDRYLGSTDLTHWYSPVGRWFARFAARFARMIGAQPALLIGLVIGLGLAVALTLVFAQIYDAITDDDGVAGLDLPLLHWAVAHRSPVLDAMITGYTDIGGVYVMPIIAVAVAVALSVHRRSWTPAILIVAAGGGSLLMTVVGKQVFARTRPPLRFAVPPYEHSPSFPSGHTLNAFVIAGIIAYLLIIRQKSTGARVLTVTIAAVFAVTIGLSRVFLGHHWFTDVLGAWVLGAAWLSLVITAHRLYLTARGAGVRDGPPQPRLPGDRRDSRPGQTTPQPGPAPEARGIPRVGPIPEARPIPENGTE
ncbi:MAG: phosphatase PAP2 family protein [Lacisediminihabitans sp.]